MRVWTLGSGSKGNSILVECDGTRVLIDAGYSPRELAKRLATIRVVPQSISAVIVTHEHIDHMRGLASAQRRWKWPVFGSAGTVNAIAGLDARAVTAIRSPAPFMIGALQFELVRVPHDATAPTAVLATSARTGFRTGIAHDLGAVPNSLRAAFAHLDLLLLESNHDEEMLRTGPYPPFLQARISGGSGHLSNRQSAALTRDLASPQLRQLVLLHLSEENNTPAHATAAAQEALRAARVRCAVTPAPQHRAAGPFGDASGGERQLALAL